jgi:hypothetical protein
MGCSPTRPTGSGAVKVPHIRLSCDDHPFEAQESCDRFGKGDRADQGEIRRGITFEVVERIPAAIQNVVDLAGGLVVRPAALPGLVTIGPFVVAGRVDERAPKLRAEVVNRQVVRLGAVLLARMNVPDVPHERTQTEAAGMMIASSDG